MASHNILLGYDNALSKLSHVELVDNALKVTDVNSLTKLDLINAELMYSNNHTVPNCHGHSQVAIRDSVFSILDFN